MAEKAAGFVFTSGFYLNSLDALTTFSVCAIAHVSREVFRFFFWLIIKAGKHNTVDIHDEGLIKKKKSNARDSA